MMPLTVGTILQVRMVSFVNNQLGLNIRHAEVTQLTGATASEQDVANEIDLLVHAAYKAVLPNLAGAWRGVGVRAIRPLPVQGEWFSIANTGPGDITGQLLPKQSTGLIKFEATFRNPRGRGRNYIPFPSEEDSDAPGQPSASYVARIQSIGNLTTGQMTVNLTNPTRSFTINWGVFSRIANALYFTQSAHARTRWATQRRRGDFGRTNVLPF